MGVAVQANLIQLKVAFSRRAGAGQPIEGVDLPSPGCVSRFRETLIPRAAIKRYGPDELILRLHEVWGGFCMIAWALQHVGEHGPGDITKLPEAPEIRCDATLEAKRDEIHALLWRLRIEQQHRAAPDDAPDPLSAQDRRDAARIPAVVFHAPVADADDQALLRCACEYAGMLAAIRWILDRRLDWNHPGIMNVHARPF
jgi:hypothetical protein